MRWRPLYGLLPLLGALGPLGCESWRHYSVKVETPFGVAWLGRPVEPDADKAGEDDLARQVARSCLVAAERLDHEGRLVEAVAQLEQARHIDPGVRVARRLAVLYDREGQPQFALAEYRRALREGPRDASLFNDLGYCYYRQGDYREAESWLRQAVAVNPAGDRAWLHLGLVLGQEGRYEECCDAFARAIRPGQGRTSTVATLAEEGRLEEAKGSLHKALELEPGLQLAQLVLNVLEQSPTGVAPAKAQAEATPAAHFHISQKRPAEEDGPWLPDLAE